MFKLISYNIFMRREKIKILATDLDGTLFYPKRRIRAMCSKNKKFLREFIKNGNRLVLVSGRNYQICERISKVLKTPIDMIGCNGSIVMKDNKFLFDEPIDHDEAKKFLDVNLKKSNVAVWTVMSNKFPLIMIPTGISKPLELIVRLYMRMQFAYRDNFVVGEKYLDKLFSDDSAHIYKIMAIYGIGKKKEELARQETDKYIDAYGTKFEVLWSKEAIEFMKKGVNKANALKKFINVLKIEEDAVAVVGDSGNDIPLFESFANSFVMAQAPDEVKQKAKTEVEGVYCIKDYIN